MSLSNVNKEFKRPGTNLQSSNVGGAFNTIVSMHSNNGASGANGVSLTSSTKSSMMFRQFSGAAGRRAADGRLKQQQKI